MFVTELREGVIRDTVQRALESCPKASGCFEQGDLKGMSTELYLLLREHIPAGTPMEGPFPEGSLEYKLSEALRMLRLIGLDQNQASNADPEADSDAA